MVPVLELPRGSCDPAWLLVEHRVRHILVLDGLLVQQLSAAGSRAAELIAPGDLFELGSDRALDTLVRLDTTWSSAGRTRVALLTEGVMLMAARWPRLILTFVARIEERSVRLATQVTISHMPSTPMRLLALFWHLAERFGKVGADHVVLPLRLLHRTLGAMVGAERSTVTLALRDLATEGLVRRRDDGAWMLYGDLDKSLTWLSSTGDRGSAVISAPEESSRGASQRFGAVPGELEASTDQHDVALSEYGARTAYGSHAFGQHPLWVERSS